MELENRLTRLLAAPGEDEPTHLVSPHPHHDATGNHFDDNLPNEFADPATTIAKPQPFLTKSGHDSRAKEVAVRSQHWKRAFQLRLGYKSKCPKSPRSGEIEGWWEDPNDPVHTLHSCAKTMQALWADPQVKRRLQEKHLRLEESSGLCIVLIFYVLSLADSSKPATSMTLIGLQPKNTSQLMVCSRQGSVQILLPIIPVARPSGCSESAIKDYRCRRTYVFHQFWFLQRRPLAYLWRGRGERPTPSLGPLLRWW